jgi:hypothetical protein
MRIRSRHFWPVSIFLLISCNTDCPDQQQTELREQISGAFAEWKESLNYMDEETILEADVRLRQSILDAAPCIPVDSAWFWKIDSVNTAFIQPVPGEDQLIRAAEMTLDLEERIRMEDPD